MSDTLTPAEVAALRTALGLSQDQLGRMLGVNVRSVRSWESGRDRVSGSSADAVRALAARHDALTTQMLEADVPVAVDRGMPADAIPPRAWYLAAAGRAMLADPDLMVEWA